jgi:hypothetical protein
MTQLPHESPPSSPRRAAWSYAWWAVVGVVLGVALVGMLSIGIFVLPVGLVLLVIGLSNTELRNESAVASLAGLGVPALYLAWLNKDGPGTVCTAGGSSCEDQYSPWPFVAVAVVLVVATVVLLKVIRKSPL